MGGGFLSGRWAAGFLLCLWSTTLVGQERYLDSIFERVRVQTLVYADTLGLDYYAPAEDAERDRPLLLLVHGGGFAIGRRDNELEREFSEAMARKGYAVASISYHLTRRGKGGFSCDCPVEEKMRTFRTASQNVLQAANFLLARSEELGFNPRKIVLIGSSAGAEAVLNTAFLRYHRDFRELPYGKLRFAALVSFAGAVVDASYITPETALPTLMFHGQEDQLVPFATAPHHYCPPQTPGYLILHGSAAIADRLNRLNVSNLLYIDPIGNHDWANAAYDHTDAVAEFLWNILEQGARRQGRQLLNPLSAE